MDVQRTGKSFCFVRDLTEGDLGDLAWSGTSTHLNYVSKELARAQAGEADYLALVAEGRVVGIAAIDYELDSTQCKFWQLVVHPGYRSKGYGSTLLEGLERRAIERGCEVAKLSVEKNNRRALALYVRLGYVIVGEAVESWDEQGTDGEVFPYVTSCFVMEKFL